MSTSLDVWTPQTRQRGCTSGRLLRSYLLCPSRRLCRHPPLDSLLSLTGFLSFKTFTFAFFVVFYLQFTLFHCLVQSILFTLHKPAWHCRHIHF